MNNQHKHFFDNDEHTDDVSVLNYLLEHVHGISPSSLTPEYALDDATEIE